MSASSIVGGFDGLFSGIAQAAAISHINAMNRAPESNGVNAVIRVSRALQRERSEHARTRAALDEALARAEAAEAMLVKLAEVGVI
jgi:hypothetical protein